GQGGEPLGEDYRQHRRLFAGHHEPAPPDNAPRSRRDGAAQGQADRQEPGLQLHRALHRRRLNRATALLQAGTFRYPRGASRSVDESPKQRDPHGAVNAVSTPFFATSSFPLPLSPSPPAHRASSSPPGASFRPPGAPTAPCAARPRGRAAAAVPAAPLPRRT